MPQFVLLWTDLALWALVLAVIGYALSVRRRPNMRATWRRVLTDTPAMCSAVVLSLFVAVGLLDSIHFRPLLRPAPGASADAPIYAPIIRSAFEQLVQGSLLTQPERRFSAPLGTRTYYKESIMTDQGPVRDFRRLEHGGRHLADPDAPRGGDIGARALRGVSIGLAVWAVTVMMAVAGFRRRRDTWREAGMSLLDNTTSVPIRAMLITWMVVTVVAGAVGGLVTGYHVFGTDIVGNNVLWQALRSIRTALVIGSLTTLAMLPPALALGISAGYFKGRVDDIIQYIYTTMTSIPSVLLVAACVLLMQAYIDTHPEQFPTSAQRADLRLFMLCMILGLTGWAALCRLLRAETLKLREQEYIQAARAFGISHLRIMLRHILPNVMHIVLITLVLEFSGLVLYEAVLSYLGIGVDPTMASFGAMIDSARMDMSRQPMVWWSLVTAFAFMLALVLSTNLFADAVRVAFDPRSRAFRVPRRRPRLINDAPGA
jgi:peptide/nickel transport system permease protein